MSDIIQLLPDSVANQIAAGEVIQRPASVVKELVENAIDAQATAVEITLKDAGRTLIQISDNGIGMSPTDARLAFERHSTSKIRNADDLFSLHTMGFRGEALASICAISQVELRTQRQEDTVGTQINVSASKYEKQEPCMYGKGTCFKVKNIFFNVPARRKFLKSNQVELSNILREFERLSLINENVDFTITHNDTLIHNLVGGSFKQRIVALFGKSLENQIIPVNVSTSIVKIEGFVSFPEFSRKRNYLQYLFVNGRFMKHPYFHKAVTSCYDQLIPQEQQPNYFLKFTVDPATIDVNIHPTKTEIKFENEQLIWPIITAAVKESIGKFSTAPTISFDNEDAVDIPVVTRDTRIVDPDSLNQGGYNPFMENERSKNISFQSSIGGGPSVEHKHDSKINNWESLYESFLSDTPKDMPLSIPEEKEVIETVESVSAINNDSFASTGDMMQIKGRYIISQAKSGIMVVDQHRAHFTVLYNELLRQHSSAGRIASQRIIFPETLELQASQAAIMNEISEDMQLAGFDVSYLGGNSWSINSVPAGINDSHPAELVLDILSSFNETARQSKEEIIKKIMINVAQSASLSYNQLLSKEEMDSLVGKLLALPVPNYTPTGKPVIKIVTMEQLGKLFS